MLQGSRFNHAQSEKQGKSKETLFSKTGGKGVTATEPKNGKRWASELSKSIIYTPEGERTLLGALKSPAMLKG